MLVYKNQKVDLHTEERLQNMKKLVLGSLIAVLLLVVARYALWPKIALALPWIAFNAAPINGLLLIAQLVAAGGAIGIVASWISVGRHLRT